MKLFLSADIEGTCGITDWDETHEGGALYPRFCSLMSGEVAAACNGAKDAGWAVLVKDAHNAARNIDHTVLPDNTEIIRGWIGDMYSMMGGIDRFGCSATAYTGYHSEAYSDANPLAHTMTRRVHRVTLNGILMSEFMYNAYIAAYNGIPSVFISGDAGICDRAKELIPDIFTVASKEGVGNASLSRSPSLVRDEIRETLAAALEPSHVSRCLPEMPEHFTLEITYRDTTEAYRNSFYPGVIQTDVKTLRFETGDWLEVMRAVHFIM